ncbi:hypothetical protein OAG1_13430 [Agarivorans sp. OAG1]|uniref:hypothetical protein n=1 Tax=Agarivorans sp. OAG1 TaxID=3082387 RepID=UPI002B2A3F4D|nr:hypothetical protein OAG1_13430 [Agarivorans sp. OAG1]
MNETQQHYIETILPYRLYAVGAFEMALHLVAEFPEGADIECTFDGKPKIQGRSTAITNPTIEMGIVHSRVLFEFLGLKLNSKMNLAPTTPRKTDISIESFGLEKVSAEEALAPCNGDKTKAGEAVINTLKAANKLVAHSTDIIKMDNDSIKGHLMTCKAIPVLFNLYFFKKLGLPMPNSEIEKNVHSS